jgi:hypothetical protein
VPAARTAQHRAQARFQFRELERLGHIVVRAGVQARHAAVEPVERREDQHRQAGPRRAQVLQHRETVDHRQAEVDDGDVEVLPGQQVLRDRTVGRMLDGETGGGQLRAQSVREEGVVFGE